MLSKQDEENYIRAIREKEEKDIRKDDERSRNLEHAKSSNIELLSYQIREK